MIDSKYQTAFILILLAAVSEWGSISILKCEYLIFVRNCMFWDYLHMMKNVWCEPKNVLKFLKNLF